jgi:hypothetical protein
MFKAILRFLISPLSRSSVSETTSPVTTTFVATTPVTFHRVSSGAISARPPLMISLESRLFLSTNYPPAPATGLKVSPSGSHIEVTWKDNSTRETGYEIDRGTSKTNMTKIGTVGANKTSYQDSPPKANTTYYYTVRAYNSYGDSSGPSPLSAKVTTTSSSSSSSSSSTTTTTSSKTSGTSTGSGFGTDAPIETPGGATVIYVGSSRSVKSVDQALNETGKGKNYEIIVDPGTYTVSHHALYGNVTITASNDSNEPVFKMSGNDYPTLYNNGNLIINHVKITGGGHVIVMGSTPGSNINAQDITTDGGAIWIGSGGNNIYMRDNDVFGKAYKYVYGNFNNIVNSCTIDNSGDSNPIPQGGSVSGGSVSGEAAIRVMDVNDLTIIGVKTTPFFYKSGQEWKQDVQIRPSSDLIRLIDCTFYNPDIGDMTWRSPAHPVDEVDFINCTITKDVSLEAGAKLVKFENTTIAGKMHNNSESYS